MQAALAAQTKAVIERELPSAFLECEVVQVPKRGVPTDWRVFFCCPSSACASCKTNKDYKKRDMVTKRVTKSSTPEGMAATMAAAMLHKHAGCLQAMQAAQAGPMEASSDAKTSLVGDVVMLVQL